MNSLIAALLITSHAAIAADPTPERIVRFGHAGAFAAFEAGQTSLNVLLALVQFATLQAGAQRFVTTGTVTEGAQPTYAPNPADKLVFVRADGTRYEYTVGTYQGASLNPNEFVGSDYAVAYRVTGPMGLDASLYKGRSGINVGARIEGQIVTLQGELLYASNLTAQGTETFEHSGGSGTGYENKMVSTGMIQDSDRKITVKVQEGWQFDLQSSSGVTVSSSVRTIQSTVETLGSSFQWQNAKIYKNFKRGKPSEESFWKQTRGDITRDGAAFGSYRLDIIAPGTQGGLVKIMLGLASGQSVELESIVAY